MAGGRDEVCLGSNAVRWSDFGSGVDAVCHLALQNRGEAEKASSASGFLAKCTINGQLETVIMTNNHFIHTKEEASKVTASFYFDGKNEPKLAHLDPDGFFRTDDSEGLDYTMVRVRESDLADLLNDRKVSPIKLDHDELSVNVQDVIYIPQHPQGRQKRISLSNVAAVGPEVVCYKADTDDGSSGSPVFCVKNGKMEVLAIHKAGGATLPNGDTVNKGILISAILKHVNGHNGSLGRARETSQNESGMLVGSIRGSTNQGLPVTHPKSPDQSDYPSEKDLLPAKQVTCETPNLPLENLSVHDARPKQEIVGPPADPVKSHETCQKRFTAREMIRIAKRIPEVWERVALYTGAFEEWEITNIQLNPSLHDSVLKANRMLNDFKSRLGTRQILAGALDACGKAEESRIVSSGQFAD